MPRAVRATLHTCAARVHTCVCCALQELLTEEEQQKLSEARARAAAELRQTFDEHVSVLLFIAHAHTITLALAVPLNLCFVVLHLSGSMSAREAYGPSWCMCVDVCVCVSQDREVLTTEDEAVPDTDAQPVKGAKGVKRGRAAAKGKQVGAGNGQANTCARRRSTRAHVHRQVS